MGSQGGGHPGLMMPVWLSEDIALARYKRKERHPSPLRAQPPITRWKGSGSLSEPSNIVAESHTQF